MGIHVKIFSGKLNNNGQEILFFFLTENMPRTFNISFNVLDRQDLLVALLALEGRAFLQGLVYVLEEDRGHH